MEGLFNINSILLHMLNAVILFAAVYLLLYKPVRKFLKSREDKINAQFEAGAKAEQKRDEIVSQGKAEIDKYRLQVEEEIAALTEQTKKQNELILEDARRTAGRLVEDARTEAEHIIEATRSTMLEESALIASEMAASVISRELTDDDQHRLVDEFLERVESR